MRSGCPGADAREGVQALHPPVPAAVGRGAEPVRETAARLEIVAPSAILDAKDRLVEVARRRS